MTLKLALQDHLDGWSGRGVGVVLLRRIHSLYYVEASIFPQTGKACFPSKQVKRDVGDVTVLINNAGVVSGKKFFEVSDDLSQLTFEVNTMAHFWVSLWLQQTCMLVLIRGITTTLL